MGTRLGTDYQHEVAPTNTYTILNGDDVITPLIATGKTFTLPPITGLGVDDKRKIIGNNSGSAGNATYAAAAGDSIRGLTVMLPGQEAEIRAVGRTWTVFGAVVDSGTGTTATSVADSKAVSNSVVVSANLTVANSKDTSSNLRISTVASTANSA